MKQKKIILNFLIIISCMSPGLLLGNFFHLVARGNIGDLKSFIEKNKKEENKILINKVNKRGFTPLTYACFLNKPEMIKLLVKINKKSINKADNKGRTPLSVACGKNNINMVKLLLKNGAKESINKANNDGETPLYWACIRNNIELVKLLLKNGAKESINKANNDGNTPLYWACDNGDLNMIKLLLENGAKESINKANNDGDTVLGLACMADNSFDMVKFFLDKGAKESINKADNDGKTPLYWVCSGNHNIKTIILLLINGAEIDEKVLKLIRNKPIKKKYIEAIKKYNEQKTNKLEFILSKKEDKPLFNFLVKVAFGRVINKNKQNQFTPIMDTVFYKLHIKLDEESLEKIFGVKYQKDIFKFIKAVIKNKKKNFFYIDKSFFKQEKLEQKKALFDKIKRKAPYSDMIIHTES